MSDTNKSKIICESAEALIYFTTELTKKGILFTAHTDNLAIYIEGY